MNCAVEKCPGEVKMTHVFKHGLTKVSRAKCDTCGQVYTGFLKYELFEGGRGTGAAAMAQKVKDGRVEVEIKEDRH